MRLLPLILCFFLLSSSIVAQDNNALRNLGINIESGIPKGLKVGDKAPNFTALDQNGNTIELSTLLKEGPVVLNFYRGDWCPVCSRYMSGFQESLAAFEEKKVSIVSVTPETQKGVEKFIEKTRLSNSVVVDADNSIMESYDVIFDVTDKYQKKIRVFLQTDIAEHNNKKTAKLPIPATYIINSEGIITYVHFDVDYKERASVEEILGNL